MIRLEIKNGLLLLFIVANKIGQIDDVMLSEVTLYGFKKSSQHFDDLEKKFYDQGIYHYLSF